MSSSDDLALSTTTFRIDNLIDGHFSKASFIHWINDDSWLSVFDRYCVVYRLTPFSIASSSTDRFPISVFRIDLDKEETPTVLKYSMKLLNYAEIDANDARSCCDVTEWKSLNETMADAVFLQPGISSYGRMAENEQPVMISEVSTHSVDKERSLITIVLADGRAHAALVAPSRGKYQLLYLTSILFKYISQNNDAVRKMSSIFALGEPQADCTTLRSLKAIRQLGCVLSVKHWLPTDLRFPDGSRDTCLISVQRSGHLIFWRCGTTEDRLNFQVCGLSDELMPLDSASAAAVLPVDQTKCFILLGTDGGYILSFSVQFNEKNTPVFTSSLPVQQGEGTRVSTLRLFPAGSDRYLLIATRHVFLTTILLSASSTGSIVVVEEKLQRTQRRFAVTDVFYFDGEFYIVSLDKISKYEIRTDGASIDVDLILDSVIPLDESEKLVGLRFSKNGILRLHGTVKRFLDRYSKEKPLSFHARMLLEPVQFWSMLMERTDLKDASDILVALRAFVLHPEQSKTMSELLIQELESLDSNDDPNTLFKLKVLRFATIVFSMKRGKAEDIEFWQRVKEKVERLLLVRMAKLILDNAKLLDLNEERSQLVPRCVASVAHFLIPDGTDVQAEFLELERPRCPLCNVSTSQSMSISEHVCSNNHRLPACSLSFLPITSFSYRKCVRCSLPALDSSEASGLADLIGDIDHCRYCDGAFVASWPTGS